MTKMRAVQVACSVDTGPRALPDGADDGVAPLQLGGRHARYHIAAKPAFARTT
jgi:hypothetical protein